MGRASRAVKPCLQSTFQCHTKPSRVPLPHIVKQHIPGQPSFGSTSHGHDIVNGWRRARNGHGGVAAKRVGANGRLYLVQDDARGRVREQQPERQQTNNMAREVYWTGSAGISRHGNTSAAELLLQSQAKQTYRFNKVSPYSITEPRPSISRLV